MDASPYYTTLCRGNDSQCKRDLDGDGLLDKWPLCYDNYFVPRGYAIILLDMVGTGRSTGCPTTNANRALGSRAPGSRRGRAVTTAPRPPAPAPRCRRGSARSAYGRRPPAGSRPGRPPRPARRTRSTSGSVPLQGPPRRPRPRSPAAAHPRRAPRRPGRGSETALDCGRTCTHRCRRSQPLPGEC
ncbi:CocE/NonD family hydrolase [Micromonospora sp. LOL_023]|uniref:CocE/NonD family hydrolase n=1 Tax=Micromonospora sp. LOL_023 TaxID=3345418 RepID=UPI003A8C8100